MKRCWYSLFLSVSLTAYLLWTNGTVIYENAEAVFQLFADREKGDGKIPAAPETETVKTDAVYQEEKPEREANTTKAEMESSTAEQVTVGAEETAESIESGADILAGTDGEKTDTPEETKAAETEKLFPDNFQGTLFIGDSRTVGLHEYGHLESADVFADSGMSVFNLWSSEVNSGGQRVTLQQILSQKSYQTIHLMLGINELGYSMDLIAEKYREAVGKIRDMQPQAVIVLGANLHVTEKQSASSNIFNNRKINEVNDEIERISREMDCKYIDINEKFDDGSGNLAKEYSVDGSHILGKYYADWVKWLQEK